MSTSVDSSEVSVTNDAPVAPRGTPCEKCGALVEPGDKFCHACGTVQSRDAANSAPAAAAAQRRFSCKNCGAEVLVDAGQRSFTCPFCDSAYVHELPATDGGRQRPEFVIGFAIPANLALERFQAWLKTGNWFRPGDLKLAQVQEKLRGVYLPFWSFSMMAQSHWSAKVGEYWYRTETYTTTENGKSVTHTRQVRETEWWPLAGAHQNYYSGYLVSGSKGLPQAEAERLKPFNLPALKRYEPFYLAGWLSEEFSLAKEQALEICKQEFTRQENQSVAKFLPGDTHSGVAVQTEFSDVNSDLVLLPVYLLSYRYGDKIYRFLLNGQTGQTAGYKPLSWRRIGLAALGGLLLLILLFLILHGLQR